MTNKLSELLGTARSVGPILGNAIITGQLFSPQAELTEPDPDVLCEYDPVESREYNPVQKGTSELKLGPGDRAPVDIALYPSSTFFDAGETLQLIISSDEIIPSVPYKKDVSCNAGRHVFHCGGKYDSYVMIPTVPPATDQLS